MANICANSKLNSSGKWKICRIPDPLGSLEIILVPAIVFGNVPTYLLKGMCDDGVQVSSGNLGKDFHDPAADLLFGLRLGSLTAVKLHPLAMAM